MMQNNLLQTRNLAGTCSGPVVLSAFTSSQTFHVSPELLNSSSSFMIIPSFSSGSDCTVISYQQLSTTLIVAGDGLSVSLSGGSSSSQVSVDSSTTIITNFEPATATITLEANLITAQPYIGNILEVVIKVLHNGVAISNDPIQCCIKVSISVIGLYTTLPTLGNFPLNINALATTEVARQSDLVSIEVYQYSPSDPILPFVFQDTLISGYINIKPKYSNYHSGIIDLYVVTKFEAIEPTVQTLRVIVGLIEPYIDKPLSEQLDNMKIPLNERTSITLQAQIHNISSLVSSFEVTNPISGKTAHDGFLTWNGANQLVFYPQSGLGAVVGKQKFYIIFTGTQNITYGPYFIEVEQDIHARFSTALADQWVILQQGCAYTLPAIDLGSTGQTATVTLYKATDGQTVAWPFITYDSATNQLKYFPEALTDSAQDYDILIQLSNSRGYVSYMHRVTVRAAEGELFTSSLNPITLMAGSGGPYIFPRVQINTAQSAYQLNSNGILSLGCRAIGSCLGSWDSVKSTFVFNIPASAIPGTYTLRALLTTGAIVNQYPFTLTILPLNESPQWTSPLQKIIVYKEFQYDIYTPNFIDVEGDIVTVTLGNAAPSFITIPIVAQDTGIATLSIFADSNVVPQNFTIQIKLYDGHTYTIDSFELEVLENLPPTFNPGFAPTDKTVSVGDSSITVSFQNCTDPEGYEVTVTVKCMSCPIPNDLPPFMNFRIDSLIIDPPSLQTHSSYVGQTIHLKVFLTDEYLKATSYDFNVKIPNRSPFFNNTSHYQIMRANTDSSETIMLNDHFQATDPDQPVQSLIYQMTSSNLARFVYIGSSGDMTIYPQSFPHTGSFNVTFNVSDGILYIYESLTIIIEKAPYFIGGVVPDVVLTCCGQETLKLPRVADDETNGQFNISLDIGSHFLIQQDSRHWLVDTNQNFLSNQQQVTVTLTDFNNYTATYTFKIFINHRPIIYKSPEDQELIAGQTLSYNLTAMGVDSDLGDVLSTVLRYESSLVLPSFMTFTNDILTMAPSVSMSTSFYDLELRVKDAYSESADFKSFKVTVIGLQVPVKINTGPPFFKDTHTFPDISLKLSESYTLALPPIIDPDGDQASMVIQDFVSLGLYMFCKLTTQALVIKPTDSSHAGTYPIVIILKDNNRQGSQSQSYSFVLQISDPEFDNANVDTDIPENSTSNINNTTDQIETINDNDEELFSSQSTSMVTKKKVYLPRRVEKDRQKLSLDLKAKIESVDNLGYMNVIFNRDVKIPTYFTSLNESMIELTLISKPKSTLQGRILESKIQTEQKMVGFSWSLNKFSSRKFTIDIQFNQPLQVSNEVSQLLQYNLGNTLFINQIYPKWLFH